MSSKEHDRQAYLSSKGEEIIPPPIVGQTPGSPRSGPLNWFRQLRPITQGLLIVQVLLLSKLFISHNSHFATDGYGSLERKHLDVEQLFLSVPNSLSAINASRLFATKPHMASTPGDLQTARDFLSLLQRELNISEPDEYPIYHAGTPPSRGATLGIPELSEPSAWIDQYYPVMNHPLPGRAVEIIDDDGKVVWSADLEEKADETDKEAGMYKEAVPAFHGLSTSGNATGKSVYAHYGRQQDYEELVAKGVDLKGAIVLTRYGGIFRGLKVKGAEELGAAAVLIYSDLRDDGTVTEENGYAPYPDGPARNPTSLQRGSVNYISIYPGDPTTPGYPAYENATRVDGTSYPSIPSLPISWSNAKVLLDEIAEGGQNRHVRVVNKVLDEVMPIWNVMGVIPGHIKDEVVVIGNHRDAWVMGATDPSSGTVSIHEMVKGLGALLRSGWRPLRTILIASWDAEEYALIGSTEWGEDFPEFIDEHVVAYVNLDSSTSGSRLSASASPSLSHLYREAAEAIPHPTKLGKTLWDARYDTGALFGSNALGNTSVEMDSEMVAMHELHSNTIIADDLGVNPLGSGSDYTVFLQHLGVASANGGFGSTLHDPVYHYHSVFDSERWQELLGDPGFFKHVAIAKHVGLLVLRLSGSIILPINTTHYALELEEYLNRVEQIAEDEGLANAVSFGPLRKSIGDLQTASAALDLEKAGAEKELLKALKKWRNRNSKLNRLKRKVRKAICRLRSKLGKKFACKCKHGDLKPDFPSIARFGGRARPRLGHAVAVMQEKKRLQDQRVVDAFVAYAGVDKVGHCGHDRAVGLHHDGVHGRNRPHGPLRRLIKAAKRVQAANHKLMRFERGFISDEGLPGRTWYKHVGTAPGKWLGYGATTFPALTEALTLEGNATAARYEAERLTNLTIAIAQSLEP